MLRYSHKIIVQVVSSYFFNTVLLYEQVNFTWEKCILLAINNKVIIYD